MGNVELSVRRHYVSIMGALRDDNADVLKQYIRDPGGRPSPFRNKPITEKSLLDASKKRNLLHLAVLHQAQRCVAMLLEPPYRWDPDRPDGLGWTATQLAEALNNLHVMWPLARASRELRHLEPQWPNKENQLITTCLFWPQDTLVYSFIPPDYSRYPPEHLDQIPAATPMRLTGGSPRLCGASLALLFELFLSMRTPLFECISADPDAQLPVWPIRRPRLADWRGHLTDCSVYPACLATHWIRTCHLTRSPWYSFRETFEVWKLHRFQWIDSKAPCPPSLREYCRIAIRRQLVKRTKPSVFATEEHIFPNYAVLVAQLELPEELSNFLLYRDLWPLSESPGMILREPQGKRACFYKWTDRFGVGLRIAYGFIPIKTPS